jgi:hypothetical protein
LASQRCIYHVFTRLTPLLLILSLSPYPLLFNSLQCFLLYSYIDRMFQYGILFVGTHLRKNELSSTFWKDGYHKNHCQMFLSHHYLSKRYFSVLIFLQFLQWLINYIPMVAFAHDRYVPTSGAVHSVYLEGFPPDSHISHSSLTSLFK